MSGWKSSVTTGCESAVLFRSALSQTHNSEGGEEKEGKDRRGRRAEDRKGKK